MGKSKKTNTTKVDPWMPSDGQWNTLTERAGQMMTPQFHQAMQGAQRHLSDAAQVPASGPGVQRALLSAMRPGAQMDGTFDQATRLAGQNRMDEAFDRATSKAQSPQYAQGFQETMAAAQNPNARSAAFAQVKKNAIADIMQEINSTFAGSGMTGSSLHQQNLSKGLMAGLAGVENQAHQQGMDRAMRAAQAGQSALQENRQLGLGAAGMRQGVMDASQSRELQAAGMRQDAFNADQGRKLQAAGMQNQINGQQFSRLMALFNAQQGVGNAYQGAYSGNLANMMSAATGGASRTTTQQSQPGMFGILGGGLMGLSMLPEAAAGAALLSDKRTKEDAKRVGKMDDGTPIYTYKYKGGGSPTMMGVMAQDVAKKKPKAVTEHGGILAVDYGAL